MTDAVVRLNSIRGRLWLGFGVLVLLLAMAGVVGQRSMTILSQATTSALADVQTEARLSGELSADIAQTIESGARYLETRDTAAESGFRKFGWAAHDVQRQMINRPDQS